MGVENPFDKSKWREMITAYLLGHEVFVKASNGKNNLETYGADAKCNYGATHEYKSATMSDKHFQDYLNGKLKKQYSMVYNGAYDHEIIDKYLSVNQYLCLYHESTCAMIIKVPVEEVVKTLHANLEHKLEYAEKTNRKVSTNCNSFQVSIKNNVPSIGEVVYAHHQ